VGFRFDVAGLAVTGRYRENGVEKEVTRAFALELPIPMTDIPTRPAGDPVVTTRSTERYGTTLVIG
jgi:hypothetical protein